MFNRCLIFLTGRENRDLDLLIFKEVLENMSKVDRVLTMPGGSLMLAGRSGVGRRSAALLVAHMHGMTIFTPKVSRGYGVKQFKNDLKNVSLCQFLVKVSFIKLTKSHHITEAQLTKYNLSIAYLNVPQS